MANQSIWSTDPALWPKAPREYVFLAAAFEEAGRALFPDEWTSVPPDTPLLRASRMITRAPLPPSDLRRPMKKAELPKISDEERQAYRERLEREEQAEREFAKKKDDRRRITSSWIAEKARNNELITYGLWTGGGVALVHLPPSIWNRADDWELFAACQIKTYVPPSSIMHSYFLFITHESLDRALANRLGNPARRGGSRPRFPWTDFITEAVRQLDDEGDFGIDWTQSDLEVRMAQWCALSWGREPSETSIRAKVKEARESFLKQRSV
jgi:hypothetical protein